MTDNWRNNWKPLGFVTLSWFTVRNAQLDPDPRSAALLARVTLRIIQKCIALCLLEYFLVVTCLSPPWYSQHLRMFFYTKKEIPKNNFHIISVFTSGQTYFIPNTEQNRTSLEWMNMLAYMSLSELFVASHLAPKRRLLLLMCLLFVHTLIL